MNILCKLFGHKWMDVISPSYGRYMDDVFWPLEYRKCQRCFEESFREVQE